MSACDFHPVQQRHFLYEISRANEFVIEDIFERQENRHFWEVNVVFLIRRMRIYIIDLACRKLIS